MDDDGQMHFDFESRVQREFNYWIATPDGQRVEREVTARALNLLSRKVRRYGIAALFEAIRYDWTVGLLGEEEYRLNNNHRSLLARRVMERNKALAGFFEIRHLYGRL